MLSIPCFESSCREQSSFSCSCTKSLFVCQSHIGKHLVTPGFHTTTSLDSLVPENQKRKALNYLNLKRKIVSQNLKELKSFSNELLNLIIDLTKKTQNKLKI